MKRIAVCFVAVFNCGVLIANAQVVAPAYAKFLPSPSERIEKKQYDDVDGSPYLNDNWQKGLVKLANGETFKDLDIKYDEVEQQILFRGPNGNDFKFADQVTEFKLPCKNDGQLLSGYFRRGFGSDVQSFYEVLTDGGIQLLKLTSKTIKQDNGYGENSKLKSVAIYNGYYLNIGNRLTRINRNKRSVLTAIGANGYKLDVYIKTNKLDLGNDADLSKLIMYYNSI